MDVEKLTMELRPRPHWQAIDLGFALLRSRSKAVYGAWWTLWTGIVLITCIAAAWKPAWVGAWILIPWALRPAVERIVVHILSRGVFGEEITWKQAVRAWPSLWTRDLVHVMTWWRLWALGRSFMQPIWQLEGVTGSVASRRREALSRKGAGRVAGLWGLACVHLELVLWLSVLTLVGMFTNAVGDLNPFRFFSDSMEGATDSVHAVTSALAYGLVLGFTGPIYAAGGFTLYLNRRAELEAWDIELAFKKLARRKSSESSSVQPAWLARSALLLLVFCIGMANAQTDTCSPPKWWTDPVANRPVTTNPQRLELRRELDSIYRAEPRLKRWSCEETWVKKATTTPQKTDSSKFWSELEDAMRVLGRFIGSHAAWIKWAFIGGAIGLVLWIAWKYRDMVDFGGDAPPRPDERIPAPSRAAIRKEDELEPDPTDSVQSLWNDGFRREALSLLYRLACREAAKAGAILRKGDSEGAFARAVRKLATQGKIDESTLSLFLDSAAVWSRAAWADTWPDSGSFEELRSRWRQFLSKETAP